MNYYSSSSVGKDLKANAWKYKEANLVIINFIDQGSWEIRLKKKSLVQDLIPKRCRILFEILQLEISIQ